jgi:ABC-type nitrate/sulfonate/bicarbonate transport system substrate-binding protein
MVIETRRRRAAWAAAAIALLVVAAIGLSIADPDSGAARTPLPPRQKLTIALSSTPHAALLHIASVNGYFAREGLDVDILPVSHGKAALDLLKQGRADLASAAEVPFVISVMNGGAFGIAATVASVSTEMAVVARRDHDIAHPHDLAGKKVGVTLGTSGEYFLWAFLIRNKLPPDAVVLEGLAPGEMARALSSGKVDAVSTWQPVVLAAQSASSGNAVSFSGAQAYRVTHVVVGQNDFLKKNPRAIEKLLRAVLRAERFNREEPASSMAMVARWLALDPKALLPVWRELDFKVDLRQSHLITLEDEAHWAIARGYAPRGPFPNFLPHLYLDALLAVRPDRVTVVH